MVSVSAVAVASFTSVAAAMADLVAVAEGKEADPLLV